MIRELLEGQKCKYALSIFPSHAKTSEIFKDAHVPWTAHQDSAEYTQPAPSFP